MKPQNATSSITTSYKPLIDPLKTQVFSLVYKYKMLYLGRVSKEGMRLFKIFYSGSERAQPAPVNFLNKKGSLRKKKAAAKKYNDAYHYGFNGKYKDNEWAGLGNHLNFGDRLYDPRIARWDSNDPLAKKYPNMSPYVFTGNSPIVYKDYDGKDFGMVLNKVNHTIIIKADYYTISEKTYKTADAAANKYRSLNGQTIKIGNQDYTVNFEINVNPPISTDKKGKTTDASYNVAHQQSNKDGRGNTFNGPYERTTTDGEAHLDRGDYTHKQDIGFSDGKNSNTPQYFPDANGGEIVDRSDDPSVAAHEFGHNFGLVVYQRSW